MRIRLHLPRLAEKYDEAMPQERFVLQGVQQVIARLHGFSSWDMLLSALETSFYRVGRLYGSRNLGAIARGRSERSIYRAQWVR